MSRSFPSVWSFSIPNWKQQQYLFCTYFLFWIKKKTEQEIESAALIQVTKLLQTIYTRTQQRITFRNHNRSAVLKQICWHLLAIFISFKYTIDLCNWASTKNTHYKERKRLRHASTFAVCEHACWSETSLSKIWILKSEASVLTLWLLRLV